jgi:hypothetical protein
MPFSRLCTAAAYTLCKMAVGMENMKKAFEDLVPGYHHEWAVRLHSRHAAHALLLMLTILRACSPLSGYTT